MATPTTTVQNDLASGDFSPDDRPPGIRDRRAPIAYLRRSAADAGSPGDVSRDVQDAAVRELAARDGHNGDLQLYVDWARSADEDKAERRTEYAAMLRAVERGEVSTIYSYSLDRLARSVAMTSQLLRAAKDHGVRIVTHREGDLSDDGNPSKWLHATMLAMFGDYELRLVKARSAAALERRRARGDKLGRPAYGYRVERDPDGRIRHVRDEAIDLDAIVGAVREAGTILGGARLLEQRGVPAPFGGSRWSVSALARIIAREAPELREERRGRGRRRRAGAPSPLAGLVRCHCGVTMTPNVPRGQLYCHRGHVTGADQHGRMSVTVASLWPWIREELGRLALPEAVEVGEGADELRADLDERRRRIGRAYVAGTIDDDEHDQQLAAVEAELAALETRSTIVEVPDVATITELDLEATPPEAVNRALRALWEYVELDDAMRPVRAEWRVPEWRRP